MTLTIHPSVLTRTDRPGVTHRQTLPDTHPVQEGHQSFPAVTPKFAAAGLIRSYVLPPSSIHGRKLALEHFLPRFAATVETSPDTAEQTKVRKQPSKPLAGKVFKKFLDSEYNRLKGVKLGMNMIEFLEAFIDDPARFGRSPSQFSLDAIHYINKKYGAPEKIIVRGHEVVPQLWATRPWDARSSNGGVQGQEMPLYRMYNSLEEGANLGKPRKMTVMHGPNGTGKSMIFEDAFFEMLELFSQTPEGYTPTFNWLLPGAMEGEDDMFSILTPKTLSEDEENVQSDSENGKKSGVIIPANSHANPLFLLPLEARQELLDALEKSGKLPKEFKKDFLLTGKLDTTSSRIYKALFNYYSKVHKGEKNEKVKLQKILNSIFEKHIQVVRREYSMSNRDGLVKLTPEEESVGISGFQTGIDWGDIAPEIREELRAAGVQLLYHPMLQASGGHLLYDDFWKGGQAHLNLLQAAEKGRGSFTGQAGAVLEDLQGEKIWANTNDANIINLKEAQNPDYVKSMFERMDFIPVGYELNYKSNEKIYQEQFTKELTPGRKVNPYVTEAFALWVTMTYLFPPFDEKYYDNVDHDPSKNLKKLVTKLSVLEKALLYQGEGLSTYTLEPKERSYTQADEERLKNNVALIDEEYQPGITRKNYFFYEGGTGFSPREAKSLLSGITRLKLGEKVTDSLTILDVFEGIEAKIKQGIEYPKERSDLLKVMKNRYPDFNTFNENKFQSPLELLNQVKYHYQKKIRYDINKALGAVQTEEDYQRRLRKYIAHLIALRTQEPLTAEDQQPEGRQGPNEQWMQQQEKILNPQSVSDFRSRIMEKIGTWDPPEEQKEPPGNWKWTRAEYRQKLLKDAYPKIFSELLDRFRNADIAENREKLIKFLRDIRTHAEEHDLFKPETLTTVNRERVLLARKAVTELYKMGYQDDSLGKLLHFAFSSTKEWEESIKPEPQANRKPSF